MASGMDVAVVGSQSVLRVQSGLSDAGWSGLLVLGSSSSDADLAPFVRGSHLGPSLFLISGAGFFLGSVDRNGA